MKKTFFVICMVFGVMIFLGSSAGFAQDAAKKGCPKKAACPAGCFESMDTDKDGKVTETEFMAKCKNRYNAMDADNNGSLSKDELKPCCMIKNKSCGVMKNKPMGCPFKKGAATE